MAEFKGLGFHYIALRRFPLRQTPGVTPNLARKRGEKRQDFFQPAQPRLTEMKTAFYKLDVELEKLPTASCTKPDDAQAVRKIFENDLDVDRLGVGANRRDGKIHFAFPIVVVAGRKTPA